MAGKSCRSVRRKFTITRRSPQPGVPTLNPEGLRRECQRAHLVDSPAFLDVHLRSPPGRAGWLKRVVKQFAKMPARSRQRKACFRKLVRSRLGFLGGLIPPAEAGGR